MYTIDFTKDSLEELAKFKKSQPVYFNKIQKILHELAEHPRIGIGHPEPLKGGNGVTWSRQISKGDRLIYDIYEEKITVLIFQIGGHYNDH